MAEDFALTFVAAQKTQALAELRDCNELTRRYGLFLAEPQIQALVTRRFDALKATGRVEFGQGILKKLVTVFCDSPYLSQTDYAETLLELQDLFYYFKNEAMERLSDDELLNLMKNAFDGAAHGALELLAGTSLEELCRDTRYGRKADNAAKRRNI